MARLCARAVATLVAALALPATAAIRERVPTRNLPHTVAVDVLTPPSYEAEPTRRYPVLYFLHDAQGSEEVLEKQGVNTVLLDAMRRHEMPEVLVVSPRGKGSWWVDSHDGTRKMATFLADELVPWVDGHFRTIAERRGRGVVGISMGGYGALRLGFTRPDLFAVAGGLSPAVQQLTWRTMQTLPFFIRPSLKATFGRAELDNSFRENDLYDILLSRPGLRETAPEVVVRCGTEDKYRIPEVAGFLDKTLGVMGLRHELVLEPGVHDWPYWRKSFPALAAVLGRRLETR